MKELLPRSSARVGLTRFCFLLLCGSGQRPSWLFESVTSHFAFIRSSFTLSMWLNTFACSVSHMTSLVLMSSCQGAMSALTEVSLFLAFPRLGFCIACPALRWCWGLYICPSGSCLLGTVLLYSLSRGFCKCFFAFFALSALCTVWSGLHCASCYSVHRCTVCARVRARVRVWQGSQGALWGALGAFWGWGGIGHGGRA